MDWFGSFNICLGLCRQEGEASNHKPGQGGIYHHAILLSLSFASCMANSPRPRWWEAASSVFILAPQISYQSIESSDPAVNVPGPRRTISKLRNETYHVFSNLHPGTTYLFSVRARTGKGFGQAALTEITTNISGEPHWASGWQASTPGFCGVRGSGTHPGGGDRGPLPR